MCREIQDIEGMRGWDEKLYFNAGVAFGARDLLGYVSGSRRAGGCGSCEWGLCTGMKKDVGHGCVVGVS